VAWLVPELAAGAEADPVPEDVVVVATPDPPEVAWAVPLPAAAVPAVAVAEVWVTPLGRV
jgi:hypothetical protein